MIRDATYRAVQAALVNAVEPLTTEELRQATRLSRTTLVKVFDSSPAFLEKVPGRPTRWRFHV